jgi:glutamate-1-semialdehyde 2,1-aminomutase
MAAELQAHLPPAVFDSHAHLFRRKLFTPPFANAMSICPDTTTVDVWRGEMEQLIGVGRLTGGLFTPAPFVAVKDIADENRWLLDMLATQQNCKGLALVAPEMSPADMQPYLAHPAFAGFKPYHTYSSEKPTYYASLSSYLPEWVWRMADEHGLVILLHMVKSGALADPDNQHQIRTMCLRYPNAKLVLAHAARGFHAPNTVKGLAALHGLQNVWFDVSAICESTAIKAILDDFGPRRLMWGSDFPVAIMRGKAITLGDGFLWLYGDTLDWPSVSPAVEITRIGLESLGALLQAITDCSYNEQDKQDIFCDNGLRLLGLKQETGTVTRDLYRYAKQHIPGGVQLLSKRPEQLAPDQWPAYFREARGCETWDLDGRHYYDFSTSGIGACLLGFRDPDVTRAVQRRIGLGSMCTLNAPEEVELADLLCEIHPWADQVRYARSGGETCAVAIRIARATTDRPMVAICGYHGWYDWYLAANLGEHDALRGHLLPGLDPLGVPSTLRGTAVTFNYNNRQELDAVLDQYGDRLAAVIMEPTRHADPAPGFLEAVRDGAHRCGALLVYDEISIGWRFHLGGAHLKFGVNPDIAVFAKALGNGHPIGAVIGTRAAMDGAHRSFISSTNWTESVGPAAALAAVRKMQRIDVPAHVARVGERVIGFWRAAAERHHLPVETSDGRPCLAHFSFKHEQSEALRTLYTQMMLERGFLAGTGLYPTLAHTDDVVALYGEAIDEVFACIADALNKGDATARLKGPVAHSGFRRLVS